MAHVTPAPKGAYLTNRTYDNLKWLAQIGLPGLGTLYFALAGLWGLPASEQVVGTIMALDVFLGALLGLSSKQYDSTADGDLLVHTDDEGNKRLELALNAEPEVIAEKSEIRFKVKPQ